MSESYIRKVKCPYCGHETDYKIWKLINTSDKKMMMIAKNKEFFSLYCQSCKNIFEIDYELSYHNPYKKFIVSYITSNIEKIKPIENYKCRIVRDKETFFEKVKTFEYGFDDLIIESIKVIILSKIPKNKISDLKGIYLDNYHDNILYFNLDFKEKIIKIDVPYSWYQVIKKEAKFLYSQDFIEISMFNIFNYVIKYSNKMMLFFPSKNNIYMLYDYKHMGEILLKYKNINNLATYLNISINTARVLINSFEGTYASKQYLSWTPEEDKKLEQEFKNNLSLSEISEAHKRSIGAIKQRILKLIFDNLEVFDKSLMGGMFKIQYVNEKFEKYLYYNIANVEDNINPSSPIFEYLLETKPSELCHKYNFILIAKKVIYPNRVIVKEINNYVAKKLDGLVIHHLVDYIPEHMQIEDTESNYILDLKNNKLKAVNHFYLKLKDYIKSNALYGNDYVIACVPEHKTCSKNISGVSNIVRMLVKDFNYLDGADLILRYKTIPKKTLGNRLSYKVEIKTLVIDQENINLDGKTVILIDDLTIRGDSLMASAYMLYNSGAKKVICIAIGKTINE